jgi:hypothetical protein
MKELNLTAQFSNKSLTKTLSVIALSFKMKFENKDGNIYWFDE